jgi:hemolysin III
MDRRKQEHRVAQDETFVRAPRHYPTHVRGKSTGITTALKSSPTALCMRSASGLIGAVTIVVIAVKVEGIQITPILVYVIGLVTMLALSAAYNMWPVSPAKWILRRFDHSAIYLLIAGTYTPFLAQMKSVLASAGLGVGVWLSAAIGMALKLTLPGRFDRLAVVLCLLLGWSGVIAYDSLVSALPSPSIWLLAIGGLL